VRRRYPTLAIPLIAAALACGSLAVALVAAQSEPEPVALARVDVRSETDIASLKATGVTLFGRLVTPAGEMLLVGARLAQVEAIAAEDLAVVVLDDDTAGRHYYVAHRMPGRARPLWADFGDLLYEDQTQALLRMSPDMAGKLADSGVELRAIILDPKPFPAEGGPTFALAAVTADSLIQEIIDKVDSLAVYTLTGDLSGEWEVTIGGSPYTIVTRHTYSGEPIEKATDYAGEYLEALGLSVEYHQWGGAGYPNVIAELPGDVNPDSIFIICGHIDDMPSGDVAPGADDNASGSVAVLLAAEILSGYHWPYTVRFAIWTGEEQGLWGSYYYAQRSYGLGEEIIAVLNLDMIAYNSSGSSRDIDLHADSGMPSTLDLAQLFVDVVDAYGLGLIPEIIPNGTSASDHASFWDYGYTAILGIEDFGDFNPRYHTTGDQLQYLDMSYYVEFVKASLATFAHMSGGPLPASGIAGWDPGDPDVFEGAPLIAVRPNPAMASALIRYEISHESEVVLGIYDAGGRLVKVLRDGNHRPGAYEALWDGENAEGLKCSPGVYYANLKTDRGKSQTQKLVLLK
jgi:hypothetical protein